MKLVYYRKMLKHVLKAWKKTNRWHRVIFIIVLLQFGGIPQRKPGYYCNDDALSHPYTGDTISWKLLLAVTLLLPLPFILLVEAFVDRCECESNKKIDRISKKPIVWKWYVEYAYGLLLDLVLVQIIKVLVGEPRPHFFDVCNPDTKCEGSEFVSSYQCTKTIYSDIRMADSGRSFPSGHTSIAIHAGVFMAWYLYKRMTSIPHSSFYAILMTQALLVGSAILCGISRITDRRHHWWDVLAGGLLGVGILIYTIRCLCNNFECLNELLERRNNCNNGATEQLTSQNNLHAEDDQMIHHKPDNVDKLATVQQ